MIQTRYVGDKRQRQGTGHYWWWWCILQLADVSEKWRKLTGDNDNPWYRLRVIMAINDVDTTGLHITGANTGELEIRCIVRYKNMVIKGC